MSGLPPLLQAAARGRLPGWACLDSRRRAHTAGVVALMDTWAAELGLAERERDRWRAAAWLHDALRLAPDTELLPLVPAGLRELPLPTLHGPALATRLREEGVTDECLLLAVGYHTLGHPDFDTLGLALYAADFLEPGRSFLPLKRASLRARMPTGLTAVVSEIARLRIGHLLACGRTVRPETIDFWNAIAPNAHS